jgi:tetratricopeptide (TPR) repeat protein
MPRALVAVLGVLASVSVLRIAAVSADGPLADARARITAGDRVGARVVLDVMLASGDSLSSESRMEAAFLRASLEESGPAYEERLRALLEGGLDRERQGSAHLALGQIAYWQGDFALAMKECGRARDEGRPDEGSLWEGLAATALGDQDVAQTALARAERSRNRAIRDRALIALGYSYRTGEDWTAARDAFRKVRADGPEESWWSAALLAEGESLEQLGQTADAAALYQELLKERPDAYEAPAASAHLAAMPAAASPAAGAAPAPSASGETTYSVQLGAFADSSNAGAFARALRQRGIAPVRIATTPTGLNRVLVGTGLSRARAESLGDSLGTALGVGFSLSVENR